MARLPLDLRSFRPSALSLRSRLVLLSLVLVLLGLAVSDTVVLGSVRGQLVQRVDQQLERYGGPLAQRLGTEGIPAALLMVMVRTLLREIARGLSEPAEVLAKLNASLCRDIPPPMFVTLVLGVLFVIAYKKTASA